MEGDKGVIAYHFTSDTLRDGRPIPAIGVKLEHEGYVAICEAGLHASEHPFDALGYAPGSMLHRVLMGKVVGWHDDKLVARERTILASIDATELLREYARWCAIQVIDQWEAPAVVREYLETGDDALRAEAREAAEAGAWTDARAAAWDATRNDAVRAAAQAAERAAAQAAERAAAQAAGSWAAAWDAARDAQRDRFAEMVEAAFAAE